MSISRILSECPYIQQPLGELFIEVGQREQLPFLEFLNSPQNQSAIVQSVSPGGGKLRTVEARWIQRLPETEVEAGADIKACSATNEYGDSTTTYTLETTDTFQASALVDAEAIARHCQDNSRYILESVMRLMDVLDRKVSSATATQAVALTGKWGTEVSGFYTVNGSDQLVIATRQTGGQALNEFALADILQATKMANYPGAPIVFGGAEMQRYANAVQAGCCTQYGIDLAAISAQNGFGFSYDARLATALGSQLENLVTTPGAIQLLSYNLAQWNQGVTFSLGTGYSRVIVTTPAGLSADLTMKDDCGNLSIVLTFTGKVVALPSNIYESGDKYSGVNYVNQVLITNP
jgi:hypothetical protein